MSGQALMARPFKSHRMLRAKTRTLGAEARSEECTDRSAESAAPPKIGLWLIRGSQAQELRVPHSIAHVANEWASSQSDGIQITVTLECLVDSLTG